LPISAGRFGLGVAGILLAATPTTWQRSGLYHPIISGGLLLGQDAD